MGPGTKVSAGGEELEEVAGWPGRKLGACVPPQARIGDSACLTSCSLSF